MQVLYRLPLKFEAPNQLAVSLSARLAQLFRVCVLQILCPELQLFGALLVKLDRDRVFEVAEQLDDRLTVSAPSKKDPPFGAQQRRQLL